MFKSFKPVFIFTFLTLQSCFGGKNDSSDITSDLKKISTTCEIRQDSGSRKSFLTKTSKTITMEFVDYSDIECKIKHESYIREFDYIKDEHLLYLTNQKHYYSPHSEDALNEYNTYDKCDISNWLLNSKNLCQNQEDDEMDSIIYKETDTYFKIVFSDNYNDIDQEYGESYKFLK